MSVTHRENIPLGSHFPILFILDQVIFETECISCLPLNAKALYFL